jgi:hypothetical protein
MAPSGIVPPSRLRPGRYLDDPPRCGICAEPLTMPSHVHGRDHHLGPVCRECGPHLISAITALETIIMRRG